MTRISIVRSLLLSSATCLAVEPAAVGSRRELFVEDSLVEWL
jgi:hypothetical protein